MPRLLAKIGRFSNRRTIDACTFERGSRPWDDPQLDTPTFLRRGLTIEGLPGFRRPATQS